jgi:acyl-coenzyme A thioesterase PaaI-like protein
VHQQEAQEEAKLAKRKVGRLHGGAAFAAADAHADVGGLRGGGGGEGAPGGARVSAGRPRGY